MTARALSIIGFALVTLVASSALAWKCTGTADSLEDFRPCLEAMNGSIGTRHRNAGGGGGMDPHNRSTYNAAAAQPMPAHVVAMPRRHYYAPVSTAVAYSLAARHSTSPVANWWTWNYIYNLSH